MKVLIATGLYPPEIGGPATYALLLEEKLPPLGIAIEIVPFGWVRHYPKIIRHFVYAYKLWQASRTTDIFYALDPISVGVPTWFISKVRRKPFIIRLGGDYAWEQGRMRFGFVETLDEYLAHPQKAPISVRCLASIQSFVTKRALRVVAPSQYLKGVIEKWGVNGKNVEVIYSALYPLQVEGKRDEIRAQLSFTTPTLVTAGRLVPWKGISVLISVVKTLKEVYEDITLVIIGDGEEEKELKQKVATLGLTNEIRFTGRVSKDALGAAIKAADVFVLNTAYEGLSHQLIEVMDLGTPIVTTTAGGNPELITDGVHGFLVPFNDQAALIEAIKRVLDYKETRERVVQNARARSKEFSEGGMIKNITTVLQSIYEGSK